MNIEIPCLHGKQVCILSYELDQAAWECTKCGALFELPDGDIQLDVGKHIDWHNDSAVAAQ